MDEGTGIAAAVAILLVAVAGILKGLHFTINSKCFQASTETPDQTPSASPSPSPSSRIVVRSRRNTLNTPESGLVAEELEVEQQRVELDIIVNLPKRLEASEETPSPEAQSEH